MALPAAPAPRTIPLYGDAGTDSIMGENGDDLVDGGDGGDWLFGGNGEDTLSYENDAVGVNINLATGAASGGGSQADGDHISTDFEAVWGGSGDDTLIGTNLDNEIKGNDGADSLNAGTGGDDALYGGAGNDTITMGAGLTSADTVDGGAGDDTLNISDNSGTDDLDGVRNVETIVLAAGHSYVLEPDNDVVAAGRHLDVNGSALNVGEALSFDGAAETNGSFTLTGGLGADALKGGALGDTIDGQAGTDDLWGRGGNDNFLFDTGDHTASEYVNGGDGTDTINILSATTFYQGSGIDEMEVIQLQAGVTATFQAGLITGQTWTIKGQAGTSETLEVITNGTGSIMDLSGLTQGDWEAGDSLTINGSGVGDTITGWDGDETIDAGGGNDIIYGSGGDDSIDGGAGTDRLDYTGDATARTYHLSSDSNPAMNYTGTVTGSTVNFASIEEFRAGDGDDTFEAGYGTYTLKGGGGTDVLDYSNFTYGLTDVWRGSATAGHVKYNPGAGEVTHTVETFESIIGTNQADLFRASQWADTYDGGAGDDTLSYTDETVAVSVDLKDDGSAAIVGGNAAGDVVKNFENLVGGAANDTLKGTSAANVIQGGTGDDWIEGDGGVDTLEGGGGDDLFKFHGGAFTGEIDGSGAARPTATPSGPIPGTTTSPPRSSPGWRRSRWSPGPSPAWTAAPPGPWIWWARARFASTVRTRSTTT